MRIYLAGAINGRSDAECVDWRQEMKSVFPEHELVDPMVRDYRGKEEMNVDAIVEQDKRDIFSCDVVLVRYDKPSVGTSMEILYAWEQHIPIVLWTNQENLSPWLLYHCDFVGQMLDTVKSLVYRAYLGY